MRVANEWFQIKCSRTNEDEGIIELTCHVHNEIEKLDIVYQEKVGRSQFPLSHQGRKTRLYIDGQRISLAQVLWKPGGGISDYVNPVYYPIFLARLANSLNCVPISMIMEECLYHQGIRRMSYQGDNFFYLVPPDESFIERVGDLKKLQGELEFKHHKVRREKEGSPYVYVELFTDFEFPGYMYDLLEHEINRLERLLFLGFEIDQDGLISSDIPPFIEAAMFAVMEDYLTGVIDGETLITYVDKWEEIFD